MRTFSNPARFQAWLKQLLPWLVCLGIAAVFLIFPKLDLWFSHLFFTPEKGFFLADQTWVVLLYEIVPWLVKLVIAMLLVSLLLSICNRPAGTRRWLRPLGFMALLLVLGPGLIVNGFLKEFWDRARPRDITEFGGQANFSPAWIVSDQCESNCSFVSGHAAMGFYFVGLALLARRYRWLWFSGAALAGGMIGLARIIQGGHFLSDVVFAFVAVYLTAKLLYWLLYQQAGINDSELKLQK